MAMSSNIQKTLFYLSKGKNTSLNHGGFKAANIQNEKLGMLIFLYLPKSIAAKDESITNTFSKIITR